MVSARRKRVGHTPGPWEFISPALHFVPGIRDPDGFYVATVSDYTPDLERAEANGRLLAAAPDLLAACEAILDAAPAEAPSEPEYNSTEDAFHHGHEVARWEAAEAVRAAIRKARGNP